MDAIDYPAGGSNEWTNQKPRDDYKIKRDRE